MAEFRFEIVKDPTVFKENVLPAHSDHVPFASQLEAERGVTTLRRSLNGRWRFCYAKNYTSAPKDFWKDSYDVSGWDEIPVPSNMQMEGYDVPAYVNTQYPWDGTEEIKPGEIPEKFNPVGSYVTFFELPEEWKGREIRLSMEGVESGFALWLNGQYVGYSEDSFTPSEFDLTPFLRDGENRMSVQVFKWTASSWLEDQDMYRFSGIFRDVIIFAVPKVHLEDLAVISTLDDAYEEGEFSAELRMSEHTGDAGAAGAEAADGGAAGAETDAEAAGADTAADAAGADTPESDAVSGLAGSYTAALTFGGEEILCWEGAASENVRLEGIVPEAVPWSAEYPNLYELRIVLKDAAGEVAEVVNQNVGFRRFEMKDGLMCLNGKRIVFNGVNRHEFSCDTGRTPDPETVRFDVETMKRNNINAVRTCHYPNASILYDLCDQYGVYMIAENNMESHGMWDAIARGRADISEALPGDRENYIPMMFDRINSTWQRDKNHPAVLIWSCGNESFGGTVIMKMADWFRAHDRHRLVHYEGTDHDTRYLKETTDMYTQMYTPAARCEQYIREHTDKPFILCEYTHSMGNSNGGMHKYIELADREPRYQGGFIWDFVDQAVRIKNRFGEEFQGYGGDCGERPTDYNFSGNGIVDSTRRPYGKMQEVRYNYQPLKITVSARSVTVKNRALFTPASDYDCVVSVLRQGDVILSTVTEMDAAPLTEKSFDISWVEDFISGKNGREFLPGGEYTVRVQFLLKEDTLWGKKGDEVAFGETTLKTPDVLEKARDLTSAPDWSGMTGADRSGDLAMERGNRVSALMNGVRIPALDENKKKFTVIDGVHNIGIHGEHFDLLFSRLKGGITSYKWGGREMIEWIPRPSFWRAPTDNDRGNKMAARLGVWKTATLYQDFNDPDGSPYAWGEEAFRYPMLDVRQEYADIKQRIFLPTTPRSVMFVTYRVFADGTVRVIEEYDPKEGAALPPMPEFGFEMRINADYHFVTYCGMGPEENYCDRAEGARLGVYESEAADMVEPYLLPQETGNRTGVRWAKITDRKGRGLAFSGASFPDSGDPTASAPGTMEFSAIPYSAEQLEEAEHAWELPRSRWTVVRVNLKQMGVGGDDSWGAPVLPEYLLPTDRKLVFAFDFKGI